MSLLSVRPDSGLVPSLALGLCSCQLSRSEAGGHQYSLKRLDPTLGLLMRWHYTEDCLAAIENLADEHAGDELMLAGLAGLARRVGLRNTPDVLRPDPDPSVELPWPSAIERLAPGGRSLFEPDDDGRVPPVGNMEMGHLAARLDLRDLLADELEGIRELLNSLVSNPDALCSRQTTLELHKFKNWWPWLARADPGGLGKRVGILLSSVVSTRDPYPLADEICGAIPSDLAWSEFVDALVARASGPEVHRFDLVPLVRALLCGIDDDGLVDFLKRAAENHRLREALSVEPAPQMIGARSPHSLRGASTSSLTSQSEWPVKPEEQRLGPSEYGFWCNLLGHSPRRSRELHEAIGARLASSAQGDSDRYFLTRGLAATGDAGWLADALVKFKEVAWPSRNEIWAINSCDPGAWSNDAVMEAPEHHLENVPLDYRGILLHTWNRREDLASWGSRVLGLAIAVLDPPALEPPLITIPTEATADALGRGVCQSPRDRSRGVVEFGASGSWGIDYGTPSDVDALLGPESTGKTQEQLSAWKLEMAAVRAAGRDVFQSFAAGRALQSFADMDKERFVGLARSYLASIESQPVKQFEMLSLTAEVVVQLLRFDVGAAFRGWDSVRKAGGCVRGLSGADIFLEELFREDGLVSAERRSVVVGLLEKALSDAEILDVCIAALHVGAGEALRALINEEWLNGGLARDRALAVSCLPWFGDEEAREALRRLAEHDPSLWVQDHARWASGVLEQEYSVRRRYALALESGDLMEVSAMLQCIQPALSPTFRCWRGATEAKAGPLDPQMATMLVAFWHGQRSTRPRKAKLLGRELDTYCRGERLSTFTAQRVAPWWSWEQVG